MAKQAQAWMPKSIDRPMELRLLLSSLLYKLGEALVGELIRGLLVTNMRFSPLTHVTIRMTLKKSEMGTVSGASGMSHLQQS